MGWFPVCCSRRVALLVCSVFVVLVASAAVASAAVRDAAFGPLPSAGPGPVDHFAVSVTRPVTANAPFTITAVALDASRHWVMSYQGAASFSDLAGVLSGAPTGFVNGAAQ